jgi:imidazolonepropionase-like amidohydrolase
MKRFTHLTLALVLALTVASATPLAAQQDTIVIRGGMVHTLADGAAPIENGVVVIAGSRIIAVGGPDTAIPAGAEIVDATGQHVYPGFFDAVTRIGITEIGAVDVTSDFRELGDNNPHLEAATAVHPASEIIPVTRANGVTHAVAAPQGNGIAGQGSLIHLDGWTVEEMFVENVYMVVQWPSLQTQGFDRATFTRFDRSFAEAKELYETSIADLEALLADAQRYAASDVQDDPTRRNFKLEALGRVLRREQPMLVSVNDERGIRDAIAFSTRNNVEIVIAGGSEAWRIADEVAAAGVPVILGATQSLPSREDDPYDAPYAAPGKLHAAGVKFAISTFNASAARTLPYEAATAVPYGLPEDEALKAITRYPAEIMGVDADLGTIEAGKIANLFVADNDPLDIATQVTHLFIQGRLIDPYDNKHDNSYRKYRARPQR